MRPQSVLLVLWIAWVISWMAAAAWTSPAAKRAGTAREFLSRALTLAGIVLLFGLASGRFADAFRWWPPPTGALGWALVVLAAIGFLFSWWPVSISAPCGRVP